MNLIERYIFRRALQLSLMTLVATTVIVLITQVLIRVNVLTDSGQSIGTFFRLALTLVPAMLVVVMPFALLIGASQTLSGLNADSELAVIEAAGGSRSLTAKPIVFLGAAMALVCMVITVFIEPQSNRQLRDIISSAGADLVRFAVQSGSFKQLDENLYVQISEQLPGGAFGGIFLADLRDEAVELLYYAKRGIIQNVDGSDLLIMADGEVHRKNPNGPELSIVRFASYALDFTQFGPAGKTSVYLPKERSTAFLLDPDPDDALVKKRPDLFRSELHRRFTEWIYPLSFGLIAVYFAGSARSNRQERLWSLAAAGALALAIRGAGFYVTNGAGSSSIQAALAYVVPLAAIALFAGLIIAGHSVRVPQIWVDRASGAAGHVERFRAALQLRLRGYRSRSAEGRT
jgi:lipopolysaccharide export system permease protein